MERKTFKLHLSGNKILTTSAALALILLMAGSVFAQEKQTKQYQPLPQTTGESVPANSALLVSPDEDYLIGPSDVIEIKIEDAPELSGTFRLNADGTLMLPTIGRLFAEKTTTDALALLIADKLRGNYLMSPIVSVKVKQSNSRTFFIQGAVRRPGIYQIEGRPSLLKLITIAGGLADNYGSTAYILREKKQSKEPVSTETVPKKVEIAEPIAPIARESSDSTQNTEEKSVDYELIKANINNLLRGNLEQNIIISSGDIVHIRRRISFSSPARLKVRVRFNCVKELLSGRRFRWRRERNSRAIWIKA